MMILSVETEISRHWLLLTMITHNIPRKRFPSWSFGSTSQIDANFLIRK